MLIAFSPGSHHMQEFRQVAERLYAGDPFWRAAADPPAGDDARCFLVYDGDRAIGRACGMINPGIEYEGMKTGLVGWYECDDDDDAARELLTGVVEHLRSLGCRRLLGPMNGSTWHSYRFADPTEYPPFFLDVHNKPWYGSQFEAYGFETIGRYYSTKHDAPEGAPERVARFEERYRERGIAIRPLRLDRFEEELRGLYDLSVAAFERNFLYTPISFEAFSALYRMIEPVVDPSLVLIAEDAEGVAGFIFAVPNLHERARRSLVIKTVAARPGAAARGLGTLLAEKMHGIAHEQGYDEVIHALMHEKNLSMNVLSDRGVVSRRYRLFGLTI